MASFGGLTSAPAISEAALFLYSSRVTDLEMGAASATKIYDLVDTLYAVMKNSLSIFPRG
jgi:hypothetical protein